MPRRKTQLPEDVSTLGQAIRHLRMERGITLRALAREVHVSAPFMSDLEHGRRQTDKIDEIATALGVEPDVLEQFDNRINTELKGWLADNPAVVHLLKEIKDSGQSAEQVRAALKSAKRTKK